MLHIYIETKTSSNELNEQSQPRTYALCALKIKLELEFSKMFLNGVSKDNKAKTQGPLSSD